jgi:hypothetical protein
MCIYYIHLQKHILVLTLKSKNYGTQHNTTQHNTTQA